MAHFIGSVQGTRGAVTRLSGKETGIRATLRGWNEGLQTYLFDVDGVTHVKITRDGGSNGHRAEELIYSGPLADLKAQLKCDEDPAFAEGAAAPLGGAR